MNTRLLDRDGWISAALEQRVRTARTLAAQIERFGPKVTLSAVQKALATSLVPVEWNLGSTLRTRESLRPLTDSDRKQLTEWIRVLENQAQTSATIKALKVQVRAISGVELTRAYARIRHWIGAWPDARYLAKAHRPDPVTVALHGPRTLALADAQALMASAPKPLHRLEDIRADELVIRDLLHTGLSLPDVPARPGLGVLLPMRIETRFYAPEPAQPGWRMKVRIVPDTISLHRHDPRPNEVEWRALEAMWKATPSELESKPGRAAFVQLVAEVGGARALWLVRTFKPTWTREGWQLPRAPDFATTWHSTRLAGIPDTIELWMGRAGAAPERVAILALDRAALEILDPFAPDSNPELQWWSSYKAAERVGLATELQLGGKADDIDVLYVVGLGEESPAELLGDHRDAGDLAVPELGTPTNTLEGESASPLTLDAAGCWDLLWRAPGPGEQALSLALTGSPSALGRIPGGESSPRRVNTAMVTTLWSALWGYAFKDVLGFGASAHELGVWAAKAVVPEGLLPPIRIGDQPYGVLVGSSLAQWQPGPGDPAIEALIRPWLVRLLDIWASASEQRGTVEGADTEKLLDLLGRTASTETWGWRKFVSLEFIHYLLWTASRGGSMAELVRWWDTASAGLQGLPVTPPRKYLAVLWKLDLRLPLVEPDNLPAGSTLADALLAILEIARSWGTRSQTFDSPMHASPSPTLELSALARHIVEHPPNSLLLRLVFHALLVARAQTQRAGRGEGRPLLDPVAMPSEAPTRLEFDAFSARVEVDASVPAMVLEGLAHAGAAQLAKLDVEQLERSFRAVLDTACWRLDPWLQGFAHRRYLDMASSVPDRRLGVYGWVDAPRPGAPGPTPGGLLHAPSEAQCTTAVILRDKAIRSDDRRWQMNLDSARVRAAEALADEVRAGVHLAEALGRRLERTLRTTLGDPEPTIEALRRQFPLGSDSRQRRCCNGFSILLANPATLRLAAPVAEAVEQLRIAVDTYADLLVAQAVHHVVSGRGDIAGAAMDAAAGLRTPPNLEVIETPKNGRSVGTLVLFALPPARAPLVDAQASPTKLADPAVAEWIERQSGAAKSWSWQVQVGESTQQVTLAGLGLAPCDAAVLSLATVHAMIEQSVGARVESGTGDRLHARATAAVQAIGGQPAAPSDVRSQGSGPAEAATRQELRARLIRLFEAAQLARDALDAASSGSESAQLAARPIAWRWGLHADAKAELSLPAMLTSAAAGIRARIDALPWADAARTVSALEASVAGSDAVALARHIAELATSDGRWAMTARMPTAAINHGLTLDELGTIETGWLPVVGPVRTGLAELEAYQLEQLLEGQPVTLWSDRPKDPWQLDPPTDPKTKRIEATRLLVVAGPRSALDQAEVCVSLIDRFSEVVPALDQGTSAAFGFNAPRARAPQAVVIAVPPRANGILDMVDVVAILAETRKLARARAIHPDDLGPLSALVPTAFFPNAGHAGAVSLDPEPV